MDEMDQTGIEEDEEKTVEEQSAWNEERKTASSHSRRRPQRTDGEGPGRVHPNFGGRRHSRRAPLLPATPLHAFLAMRQQPRACNSTVSAMAV